MSLLVGLADVALGLSLLGLAAGALRAPDLFAGCVRFVAFGLVMALVWARLEAPDVALAEAAIGSGITGALLLAALRRLGVAAWAVPEPGKEPEEEP